MIYENIKWLLKKSNRKIGELETYCGVSLGYFSRTSKHGSGDVSLSLAKKIARFFDISLDELADDQLALDRKIKELRAELDELEEMKERRVRGIY